VRANGDRFEICPRWLRVVSLHFFERVFNRNDELSSRLNLSLRFLNGYKIEIAVIGLFTIEFRPFEPLARLLWNDSGFDELLIEEGDYAGMFRAIELPCCQQRP
jgi:hypothetical protein